MAPATNPVKCAADEAGLGCFEQWQGMTGAVDPFYIIITCTASDDTIHCPILQCYGILCVMLHYTVLYHIIVDCIVLYYTT